MARISELHQKWMNEPKYRKAYAAMEDEFALAKAVIAARSRAGPQRRAAALGSGSSALSCPMSSAKCTRRTVLGVDAPAR